MSTSPLGEAAARRLLNRAAYGPRPEEAAAVARMTTADWIDAQLALPPGGAEVDAALAALTLPIRYPAGPTNDQAVHEDRPLLALALSPDQRWALTDMQKRMAYPERERPRDELIAATILRKVVAPDQLRERLVEFWHDHFSVTESFLPSVMITLPEHDTLIRSQALGNFAALVEATATSPAMLSYLNNRSSRAGAPNENYARELLELHTIGAGAYHPGARSWRDVPGAVDGKPAGYFDGDVWEAARAFTGWTLAMGQRVDGGRLLPNSGAFDYVERWHDGYQKRVLGQEFTPFGPAMDDGRRVIRLASAHPATARHVCGKLARFLLGDPAPPAGIARAEAAFLAHGDAPDQIARVVRALLDGPEVTDPAVGRLRRPLDAVVAASRALAIPLRPRRTMWSAMGRAGQPMFNWPSPDGQPIDATHYLGSGTLVSRWDLLLAVAANAWETGLSPFYADMEGLPAAEAARQVATLALGEADVATRIVAAWSADGRPDRLRSSQDAGLIAGMTLLAPEFQRT